MIGGVLKTASVAVVCGVVLVAQMAAQESDPSAEFPAPSLGLSVRPTLDDRHSWVEVLPANGRDLAVFAATRIDISGTRLIERARQIELLYRGPYVPVIERFSNPPRIEDLKALALDEEDLEDIRKCKPGECGVKLSGEEIDSLRQTIARSGVNWKDATQDAFRHLLLARVVRYLAEGHIGAPPYHDKKVRIWLGSEFEAIMARSELSFRDFPGLANYLTLYPRVDYPRIESFLYWSKEALGGKPIISVTHVTIVCPPESSQLEGLIIAKQIFASHYMTGAVGLTAITSGGGGSQRYLVYLNRSRTDIFDGMFGRWVRRIAERRLRAEAPAALDALRRRLESGIAEEPE